MSDTITFEEKKQQLIDALPKDDKLTEEEEFDIIENKGIRYVLQEQDKPDIELFVRPLKIAQYRMFLDIDKATRDGRPVQEVFNITIEAFSKIFKVSKEILEEYIDREDIEKISAFLGCGIYLGKGMFKKKRISQSEINSIVKQLSMTRG